MAWGSRLYDLKKNFFAVNITPYRIQLGSHVEQKVFAYFMNMCVSEKLGVM